MGATATTTSTITTIVSELVIRDMGQKDRIG